MTVPPPIQRNLILFKETLNYNTEKKRERVWEIGVEMENSLSSSLLLSYFFSCDESRFSKFFYYLESVIRDHLQIHFDFSETRKELNKFNPFKSPYLNPYTSNLARAFDIFLQYFANKMYASKDFSDEIKLKTAANVLECDIYVYFPEENETSNLSDLRPTIFPYENSQSSFTLTLFQHKEYKNRASTENTNVFSYSISVERARPLQLSFLELILKKVELSEENIQNIKQLVKYIEDSEEHFISTILQSDHCDILPRLYKSPLIAAQLSHAGFETNPIAANLDKPSPFYYASAKSDPKYMRILYDYASNCRYRFEGSVRDPNSNILFSLERLNNVFINDKFKFITNDFDKNVIERSLNVYSRFNEYQKDIAEQIVKFKNIKRRLLENELMYSRKEFICKILEIYNRYFYYNTDLETCTTKIYENYLTFKEYYDCIDSFSCLTFFDTIYELKKEFQLQENVYESIESAFYLLFLSHNIFSEYIRNFQKENGNYETRSEIDINILRLVQLFYRKNLKQKMNDFVTTLRQYDVSPIPQREITKEKLRCSLRSFPVILDELLISRIQFYFRAVDVSLNENPILGILAVERALQVLGEALKSRSTEGCVVSNMLCSRLPLGLEKKIIYTRNFLSKYKDIYIEKRLRVEDDLELFRYLQQEILEIAKRLEIVAFTQYSRLETFLIETYMKEAEKQREEGVNLKFLEVSNKLLKLRSPDYAKFNDCMEISLDIVRKFKDFLNTAKYEVKFKVNEAFNCLKYIFKFMCNVYTDNFQLYYEDINSYHQKYKTYNDVDSLKYDISCFIEKYEDYIRRNFVKYDISIYTQQFKTFEVFTDCLKQNNRPVFDIMMVEKALEGVYMEATEARAQLKDNIERGISQRQHELLRKLIMEKTSFDKLKIYLRGNDKKMALSVITEDKKFLSLKCIKSKVKEILENKNSGNYVIVSILIKMVYQRTLNYNIYESVNWEENICDHFDLIITKKARFLLKRIENMKSILMDEDDRIQQINWKLLDIENDHHTLFLMRQRFLRDRSVRSSLEMALFDCLNILNKRKEFKEIYEKVNNLFAGINLRDFLSHGDNILDTLGLLDEDDLPSEIINKIIGLIRDSEVIKVMLKLLPKSNTLEREKFIYWIEHYHGEGEYRDSILKVRQGFKSKWKSYLFLLPLI